MQTTNTPATANLLGVPVHAVTVYDLHAQIHSFISMKKHALILHANVHGINLAYQNPWLCQLYQQADVVFCDGAGVILAAHILGTRLPSRITYADWMWQLASFAAVEGHSLFFLGGKPGVAEKAARRLQAEYPQLNIVGVHDGYFDKIATSPDNTAVIAQINASQPDILLVALGMPLQEKWLMDNWAAINVSVALTGGAVFDYISGDLRRAPGWMTNHGFEWLGRLFIEPRRLWQRYLIGNPLFLWRILKQRLGDNQTSDFFEKSDV